VRLLDAILLPPPDGALDIDGPHYILRTTWRADAPLAPDTHLEFTINLRSGDRLQRSDVADLWWNPPPDWPVGVPVTVDIPDVPVRQFVSWQATYPQERR
jgi:hypothetical protein